MDRNDDGTLESAGIDTSNHITQAFGCFEINARVNQKPVGYST
jgi:hypothetical protein